MKYALQDDQRIEATPKAIGVCPCCGTEMIAKCGDRKVWHWAHKTKQTCDHWWESETQWHRDWKNLFPVEWQEVVHKADNGEKQIADVKTPDGLVIEFQHSYIRPEERVSREKFYGNMVWIVNGRRTKNDLKRLDKYHEYSSKPAWYNWTGSTYTFSKFEANEHLPKAWLSSSVKVYFDWGFVDVPGHYVNGYLAPPWNSHLICLEPESANDLQNYGRTLHAIDKKKFLTNLKSPYKIWDAETKRELMREKGVREGEPLRFDVNLIESGDVVTIDGEYLGTWDVDEYGFVYFKADGAHKETLMDVFVGSLCRKINEWYLNR